jgi:hypothetical protein
MGGGARVVGVSLKPSIKLLPYAIGFSLGVLLALNFNRDKCLCEFFYVHDGWRLFVEDVFLGGPSIVLIGPL